MKINSIKVTDKKDEYLLQWLFDYRGKNEKVWFKLNKKQVVKHNLKSGTSFLCFAILPAMVAGEDIDLNDFSISKRLFSQINKIQKMYLDWFPHLNLHKIKVKKYKLVDQERSKTKKIASLFTGGVDSFDTILQNRRSREKDKINSILYVFGFDVHFKDKELEGKVKKYLDNVAESLSLETIYLRTNLRKFTEKVILWDYVLAAVFASVTHLFEGYIDKLYIPSTTDNKHLFPDGSHPKLDPLFSTKGLKIIHYGSERSRIEKIVKNITTSEVALNNLRVCWLNYGGKVNCSVCEKCVRTMIGLEVVGVLDKTKTFDKGLTDDQLSNLRINKPTLRHFYAELLEEAKKPKNKVSKKIIESLESALKKFDKEFKDINKYQKFKGKTKNLVFIDFNGVISYDKFWKSLENEKHELHKFHEKIETFLFRENKTILIDWMIGKYTSEDVHKIISDKLNIPYNVFFKAFQEDCLNIDISEKILIQANKLKKYYKVVLATDNMDSFDRFTLPNNELLIKSFDEIDNSYNTKIFKNSDNGKYFLKKIADTGAVISNCILIDDSENNCNMFRSLGGMAFNVRGGEDAVIDVCKSILKRAASKWEWQY